MPLVYKPLQSTRNEIRLLEIQDLEIKDRPAFKLRHYPIDSTPAFVAISYAWGNQENKKNVEVDGNPFAVSQNLFEILIDRVAWYRHAGFKPTFDDVKFLSRYLWVDAICINQFDLEERAQQVRLMGKIYQTGHVCVCLDNKDPGRDRTATYTVQRLDNERKQSDDGCELNVTENEWVALHDLFAKGWFNRMWTIQEFILPAWLNCTIWNAHRLTDPLDLCFVTGRLFATIPVGLTTAQTMCMREGMRNFLTLMSTKISLERGFHNFLANLLLWTFRDRLTTDPRDKIYSLISLIEAVESGFQNRGVDTAGQPTTGFDLGKLIVDYEVPVEDVFASLVDAIVSATGSLNILCASQYSSSFSRAWIPNWADPWERYSLLTERILCAFDIEEPRTSENYNAAASTPASYFFSPNRATLHVRGIKQCKIKWLQDPPVFPGENNETVYTWATREFDRLSLDLKESITAKYGQQTPIRYDDEAIDVAYYEENVAIMWWIRAIIAAPFSGRRARGRDYWHFHSGARPEWHSSAPSYNVGELYLQNMSEAAKSGDFEVRCTQIGHRRKIFIGEGGYCGLVPDTAMIGDELAVFLGCDVPVLIRELDQGGYAFIGEAFMQGLMYGEAIEALDRGEAEVVEFELV